MEAQHGTLSSRDKGYTLGDDILPKSYENPKRATRTTSARFSQWLDGFCVILLEGHAFTANRAFVLLFCVVVLSFGFLVIVLEFRVWDLWVKGSKVEGKQLLPIGRYEASSIQLK